MFKCCFDLIVNLIPVEEKPTSSSTCAMIVVPGCFSLCLFTTDEPVPGASPWKPPALQNECIELKQSNLSNNFSVSGTGESVKISIRQNGTLLTCGDGLCDWQGSCNKQILIGDQQDEGKRHQDQQPGPRQEMGFWAQFPPGPLCDCVAYYLLWTLVAEAQVVTFYSRIPLYSDKCRWIRHYYLQLLYLGNRSYAAYRFSFSSWCGLF